MEKQLGSELLARLDLVVPALWEQWSRITDLLEPQSWAFEDVYGAFMYHQEWLSPPFCTFYTFYYILRVPDPLDTPEVKRRLQRRMNTRTKYKKNAPNGPIRRLSAKYGVPLEIIYLIADLLDAADARKMLKAFGEELSPHYWRKRIPDWFIEVEEVDPGSIDWPYLASLLPMQPIDEFASCVDPTCGDPIRIKRLRDGLWNKKRIMDMLRPVKQSLLEEIRLEQARKISVKIYNIWL